jgi:hypothetical protein
VPAKRLDSADRCEDGARVDKFSEIWGASQSMDTAGESSGDTAAQPSEVAQLRDEVANWRRRAEVAEAKAEERDRALKIAENALRALDPESSARVERSREAQRPPPQTADENLEEMPPYRPSQAFNDVEPEISVLPREAATTERDSWWRRFWRGPST